jgi:hypothetical protein
MNTFGVPMRIRKETVVMYRNHEHNELVKADVPAEDLTGHLRIQSGSITAKATRLVSFWNGCVKGERIVD